MEKQLNFKGLFENGEFKPTHLKITKKIASCKENEHLKLSTGYLAMNQCSVICPPDTDNGYYVCSGGNCVFVPFG